MPAVLLISEPSPPAGARSLAGQTEDGTPVSPTPSRLRMIIPPSWGMVPPNRRGQTGSELSRRVRPPYLRDGRRARSSEQYADSHCAPRILHAREQNSRRCRRGKQPPMMTTETSDWRTETAPSARHAARAVAARQACTLWCQSSPPPRFCWRAREEPRLRRATTTWRASSSGRCPGTTRKRFAPSDTSAAAPACACP